MATEQEVTRLVVRALDRLNAARDPDEPKVDSSLETRLFGEDGALDSLDLVRLVVITEQLIEDSYEVQVSLADDTAMSMEDNPFRTVAVFAAFATRLLNAALDKSRPVDA